MLAKIHDVLGAGALPVTESDLAGRMKFFRMVTGRRMKEAARLVKKREQWWANIEKNEKEPTESEKDRLLGIILDV